MTQLAARSGIQPSAPAGVAEDRLPALTVLLVALFLIPSNLILPALGSAGTPALMIGLVFLSVWVISTVAYGVRRSALGVRWAMFGFATAALASYVAAALRPIQAIEISAADRGMITVLGWLGITLAAMDGLGTRDLLDALLRRLAVAGGLLAALGLLQFATGTAFTNYIQLPGFVVNSQADLLTRGAFHRPSGTTIHPIEFGAVLTMALPFALHYAMHDTHRPVIRRWWPVAAIAFAVPMSISRSAIVSAIVVMAVLLPGWTVSARRWAYVSMVGVIGSIGVLVPGLIGTVTRLFTGISEDGSAKSRTDSYSLAWDFFTRSPVVGRGFKTFLPGYRILDNQYLGLSIEMGAAGIVTLLLVITTAVGSALKARRASDIPRDRRLAMAATAAVASNAVSLAFYDGFGFPMASCTFFLIIGCAGALWRIARRESESAVSVVV